MSNSAIGWIGLGRARRTDQSGMCVWRPACSSSKSMVLRYRPIEASGYSVLAGVIYWGGARGQRSGRPTACSQPCSGLV